MHRLIKPDLKTIYTLLHNTDSRLQSNFLIKVFLYKPKLRLKFLVRFGALP